MAIAVLARLIGCSGSAAIDEWVAYARKLHDQSDLHALGFGTKFSFAQALTESTKLPINY